MPRRLASKGHADFLLSLGTKGLLTLLQGLRLACEALPGNEREAFPLGDV